MKKILTQKYRSARYRRSGFTLIDIMIATLIIGLGMTALMMLMGAGTQVNEYGRDLSSAVFLAEQIRNMTEEMSYDDLAALNGQAFTGCDGNGNPVSGLEHYSQSILVEPINPATMTPWTNPDPPACRITVTVSQGNTRLSRMSWLRVAD